MKTRATLSRRRFLGTVAAATGPWIVPGSALGLGGATAPSERVVFGAIGLNGMGTNDMRQYLGMDGAQVVAVCDVDRAHRERARGIVEEHYAGAAPSGAYKGCAECNDFRELLARDDIDAITIGTPDHWHALIAIAACKAGKDIYCEKPVSKTIAEGRAIADAVKRYQRVFQTGSQLRSMHVVRFACELVLNGRIGQLHTIRTFLPSGGSIPPQPVMPVPDGFDYEMWLGPAPWAPYTERRCHGDFRWNFDYAGGRMTDMGAHDNDIAQWGNGTQFTGPVEIEGHGEFPKDGLWNTATTFRVEYTYANGVKLICQDGDPIGARFEGTEGWVFVRGNIDAHPKSLLSSRIVPNEIKVYRNSGGHHENFLECVKTRREPIAPAEAGHRSATVCHLGNIAMLLGRKLRWDPDAERFIGDDTANRMISRPMREPWQV